MACRLLCHKSQHDHHLSSSSSPIGRNLQHLKSVMYEEDKKIKSERKQNKPRPNDGRDFQRESTHSQFSIGLCT